MDMRRPHDYHPMEGVPEHELNAGHTKMMDNVSKNQMKDAEIGVRGSRILENSKGYRQQDEDIDQTMEIRPAPGTQRNPSDRSKA